MKKNLVVLFVFVHGLVIGQLSSSDISQGAGPFNLPTLPDLPSVPGQQAIGSVEMGDLESFPELLLDIPIAEGPFEASWESMIRIIRVNLPGCGKQSLVFGFILDHNLLVRVAIGMQEIYTNQIIGLIRII